MLSPDFLFPCFLVFPPANPSNLSHCNLSGLLGFSQHVWNVKWCEHIHVHVHSQLNFLIATISSFLQPVLGHPLLQLSEEPQHGSEDEVCHSLGRLNVIIDKQLESLLSCLEILLLLLLLLDVPLERRNYTSVLKKKGNPDRKTFAMWKLLGLAGGNTKKHGNKKSGESITPIRYNVMSMYS